MFIYQIWFSFVVMEEYKILDAKKPGRPKEYDFDSLAVGQEKLIRCKPKSRDGKMKSARSMYSKRPKDGKEFEILPANIGIVIRRTA